MRETESEGGGGLRGEGGPSTRPADATYLSKLEAAMQRQQRVG